MGIEGLRWQQQIMGEVPGSAGRSIPAVCTTRCRSFAPRLESKRSSTRGAVAAGSRHLVGITRRLPHPDARTARLCRSRQPLRCHGPGNAGDLEEIHRTAAEVAHSTPAGAPVFLRRAIMPHRPAVGTPPSFWRSGKLRGPTPRRGSASFQVLRRRAGRHRLRPGCAPNDLCRHRLHVRLPLDRVSAGEVLVSPRRARAAGRRNPGHHRQPEDRIRLPGPGLLPRLAADVAEHGP